MYIYMYTYIYIYIQVVIYIHIHDVPTKIGRVLRASDILRGGGCRWCKGELITVWGRTVPIWGKRE